MRRLLGLAAGAGLALLCALSTASAETAHERTERRLREAQQALPENAVETEAFARDTIARATARRLPPRVRRKAIDVLAEAVADQGRCGADLPPAEQALSGADVGEDAWRFALALNYECDDYERAGALLSEVHRRHPETIDGMAGSMIFRLGIRSHDSALLAFVVGDGWTPDDPAVDKSDLRLALIRAYIAFGDQAAATVAAHALIENGASDLGAIVVLLSEKTFDSIVSADPTRFEFIALVNRFSTNAFANYQRHPDRLSVLHALAGTLESLNRSQEALILVDDAIARIAAARRSNPPFRDMDELNWTYNIRGNLRERLGQQREALEDLTAGAERSEGGGVNVSQRLNRASMLLSNERAEEAFAAARDVSPANLSPYGRSVRRNIMVCAAAELGRTEEMHDLLAEAVAHASNSYSGLQSSAMCAGDMNLAASAFINRLDDLSERRSVILRLQSFAGEPSPDDWLTQYPLYMREDVRAAIDRTTHMRKYPITRTH